MSSKIQSMDAQIRSQDSKQTEVRALAMRIAQLLTSSNDTDGTYGYFFSKNYDYLMY